MSLYPDIEPREQSDPLGRDEDDEEPDNLLPDVEPIGWMTDESCPF